jgi:hypothetical protein
MNFQAIYVEDTQTTSELCRGGLIIKAGSRSTRQPVHMMLLCDTSGSMEQENKLQSVQKSITLLLSLLGSEDRISLITFSDASKIVLSRVIPSAEDRAAVQYRIDSLTPDGSTNMSAGLLDIRSLVEPADSGRKQGVILLTDGHANIGVMKEEGLVEIVRRIQTESPGVSLTCVAYGVDHNSELLTALAKTGGGAYNVVKNLEDVATVFGDILGGLVSVSSQGVQVQLPPGAEANTAYRCEKDSAGMTTIYIGDVYADSETTILFRNHPSKGPLRVKGTDMSTLNPIDEIVEPVVASMNQPELKPIRITELRQRTADILKEAATTFGPTMVQRIDTLIEEIKKDSPIDGHPLKPLLLEDLEEAKKLATKQVARDQYNTVEMAQHSAFLSMSKGLRSHTRHVPPNTPLQRSPGNFLSPFTTNTQAQYATVMRTASNRAEDEEKEDDYA